MVAAGVPTPRPDHARALALVGLDMLDAMRERRELAAARARAADRHQLRPVVAGVIGRKRFLYDLWGDAVNTASRMESHGAPGRIQITRATYELLADEFECEPRGTIVVKGKGEIEAWYLLVAQRPSASWTRSALMAIAAAEPSPAAVITCARGLLTLPALHTPGRSFGRPDRRGRSPRSSTSHPSDSISCRARGRASGA